MKNRRAAYGPGDSVVQVFRFRAREAGEYALTLALRRQWEDDAIAFHTVTVKATE